MKMNVVFKDATETFKVNFGEIHEISNNESESGCALYEGKYEVTPEVNEQSLPTKNKHLIDDVTIKAIPFFKVGNEVGGNTVYIGNEV